MKRAPRPVYSLRRRLVALLIGVVALLWSASALVAFRTAHEEADALFDAQLVQVAETLLAIVAAEESPHIAHEMAEHQHAYRLPVAFQAWQRDADGNWRLLMRSAEMPESPASGQAGFDEHDLAGELWRFFTIDHEHSGYRVIVGQNHQARYRLAGKLALHLLAPILIGLPLMALAIWAVVGRALRPVSVTAKAVGGMDARQLTPMEVPGPLPVEIAPLVNSLDELMGRMNEVLANERRFTADAAHELRTPLAGLKIQAQVARRASDEAGRARALEQVLSGVDRMSHLVQQLLTLSRLDPEAASGAVQETVDLAEVAESVCSALAAQAVAHQQSLELHAPAPLRVRGNRWWLEVLLRNLVDNALRYTQAGGRIRVEVDGAAGLLRVADNGPGIAPEQRAAMLTRFARGADEQADGCGLGLSIVMRIAEILSAQVTLEEGLGGAAGSDGLAVVLRFPRQG